MSSSHCLGKSRDARRERVSIRRATVPILANGNRGKNNLIVLHYSKSFYF
jgi:hypothetical protein